MSDAISLPRIIIHTDQVHIHMPAAVAAAPTPISYTQHPPPLEPPHPHERRTLLERILRRPPHVSSSPQLGSPLPEQPSSSNLGMRDTSATPTIPNALNQNRAAHLVLSNTSGTNNQDRLNALTTALNHGGFVTLGQTMIRLNPSATTSPAPVAATSGMPPSPMIIPLAPPAEAAPTERRKKKNPKSSELSEHRFWLKGDMHEPLLELQRHSLYDAGTIVHHTRLATLVHESVGPRQTLPLHIGVGLSEQSIVYTEHELRNLFREVCLAIQILHNPSTSSPLSADGSANDYHTFPTAHRNLHLNQILVDPVTGRVSLRGFQHAIRLDQRVDPSSQSSPTSEHSGGGQEEQKVESFISTVTDVFQDDEAESDSAPTSSRFYSTAPLVFDEPDDRTNDDAETAARRHRRRLKRRAYDWFAFRAPELSVEGSPHGTAVDIWSLGAALYVLLTGLPPFRGSGESLAEAKLAARIAPYEITTEPSAAAQDLVRRMLVVDPRHRMDIAHVLSHEWLADESDDAVAEAMSNDLTLAQACLQDWGRRSKT